MDKKITTLVTLVGGTVALLNYFGKIDEEEPQNYFGCGLHLICALSTKFKVLYTREKISDYQFENFHLYSG